MKQKLLTLLAVLLTGGMLVACGPGDGTADDTTGGGVVGEPVGDAVDTTGDAFGDAADTTADTFGDDTAAFQDGATVDEDVAVDDTAVGADTTDTTVEGETVQLDLDEDVAVEGDQATTDTQAEGDAAGDEVAGGGAAPATGEPIVVTFSQAAEGVAVENVQGAQDAESIAATGETNPDLNLSVGQRYEFMYDGEGDLVFYNSNDEEILSTAGTDSEFAQDSEVNAQSQDGSLSFTMTENLSNEITRYAVGPEGQGGSVNVN